MNVDEPLVGDFSEVVNDARHAGDYGAHGQREPLQTGATLRVANVVEAGLSDGCGLDRFFELPAVVGQDCVKTSIVGVCQYCVILLTLPPEFS
nr:MULTISPECIES: hypothetical protein [unclassified Frankia]